MLNYLGEILSLAVAFSWTATALCADIASHKIGPQPLNLIRMGPFLGVSMSLMAVSYAKAGIASTLMALTPVLIILPYSLIYKQKIKLQEVLGTIVTLVGVAMFFML